MASTTKQNKNKQKPQPGKKVSVGPVGMIFFSFHFCINWQFSFHIFLRFRHICVTNRRLFPHPFRTFPQK